VIEEVGGAAEVVVDRSILEGRGFAEALRLRARATRVTLDRLERGGHLDVDGGSMEVTGSAGDLTITTNAAVTLRDNHAAIHVDGYGAPVSVIRNDGLTEIKTDGVPVSLEAITGPVRVQGDDLDLRLDDIRGELMVFASESRIEASEAGGSVTIENERGDVSIANARDEVTVRNLDGDVNLTGMAGSVWVEADGSQVVVEWVSLNHAEDSFVGNESGDVSIFFPVRGGCSFEGTTRFGRIESDLAGVELSNDDRSGSGGVNGGEGPAIRVESDGDILLRMAERSEVPQRKGPLRRSESRRDPARQ